MASTTSGPQRRVNPAIVSLSHSLSRSTRSFLPKATPSLPDRSGTYSAILLDAMSLHNPSTKEEFIGNGRFGCCVHMVFKGCFDVCVKKFDTAAPINSIKAKAFIMTKLNIGMFAPHCFGINVDLRALVMSIVSVDNQSLTMHTALTERPNEFHHSTWMFFLLYLARGLKSIHSNQILHNDLKQDNVVLGQTAYTNHSIIINFGKACFISAARSYHLSQEEKAEHKLKHTQIAPDL